MNKERLDVLSDVSTLNATKFSLKYTDVIANDGRVRSVVPREPRLSGLFSYAGRRYYHIGPAFRKVEI